MLLPQSFLVSFYLLSPYSCSLPFRETPEERLPHPSKVVSRLHLLVHFCPGTCSLRIEWRDQEPLTLGFERDHYDTCIKGIIAEVHSIVPLHALCRKAE